MGRLFLLIILVVNTSVAAPKKQLYTIGYIAYIYLEEPLVKDSILYDTCKFEKENPVFIAAKKAKVGRYRPVNILR